MAFTGNAKRWFEQKLEGLTFPDSWLAGDQGDWAQWRAKARAALATSLGRLPDAVDFETRVIQQEEREGYTATLLSIAIDSAFRTQAYFLLPHGQGPFPGLLALHDHGAFFRWGKEKLVRSPDADHPALAEHVARHYGGRFVADELARRGYAVLAIDQWLWGAQRVPDVPGAADLDLSTAAGVQEYHRLFADFERQVSFALVFAGCSMPGQMVHADRRSLDWLAQQPQVDAARLGCVGLSVGAFRAVHLTAMDDRIQAAVEIGWMCALQTYLREHDHLYRWPNVLGLCAPGLARHLDYPDLVGMACPRPFMLMAGRQDGLYPLRGVEEAFDKIRAIYASQNALDQLETRWYNVPHCFDVPMQKDAFAWLDRWLLQAPLT